MSRRVLLLLSDTQAFGAKRRHGDLLAERLTDAFHHRCGTSGVSLLFWAVMLQHVYTKELRPCPCPFLIVSLRGVASLFFAGSKFNQH